MIKAVIFDLNGVFLQSEYLTDRLEKEYGVPSAATLSILKEVLKRARRPGVEDSFDLWSPKLKNLGIDISREDFFDFWFSGEHLVTAVREFALKLREGGLKVFVLSNNFKERTIYYRENLPEIFSAIDKAYFSWETGFVKPDPEAYRSVLNEHGLNPEEVVYFDDSEDNVAVSKGLGMHAQKYRDINTAKKFLSELNVLSD